MEKDYKKRHQCKLSASFNLMKKIILSTALAIILLFSLSYSYTVSASSVARTCEITGKVTKVTNDDVYFAITKIRSFEAGSNQTCNIMDGATYKFYRPTLLQVHHVFLEGQVIIVGIDKITSMGPGGVVSGDQWTLDTAGSDRLNLPMEFKIVEKTTATDNFIEGRTYTVKELNTNISTTPKKFFTEAHVTYVYKQLPCPPGTEGICEPPRSPYTIISDENTRSSYAQTNKDAVLRVDNYSGDSFKVGGKYRFEVSVRNISNTSIPENEFTLISVKDSSNQIIATSTSQVVGVQPVKKSFVARFISWILSIFGK